MDMKEQETRPVILKSTLDYVNDYLLLLSRQIGFASRASEKEAMKYMLQFYKYAAFVASELQDYHHGNDAYMAGLLKKEFNELLNDRVFSESLSSNESITYEVRKGAEFIYSCLTELKNHSVIHDGAD